MILEDATKEAFNHYPSKLAPKSNMLIIAACELCGEFRVTSKHAYRTFCGSCMHKGKKNPFFGKQHTEETKALMSKNHGDFRGEKHPLFGKHHTEESKALQSAARKGKYVGEKAPRWLNGISFEPYCIKFNDKYKNYIRNLFGNECFLCGLSEVDNGQALSVHHVNYNKQCGCDGSKCVCVPLCKSGHSKTNANREYWKQKILFKLNKRRNRKMSMKWIREHYRVPAKRGMHVIVQGSHGTIVGSMRGYLRIKLYCNPKPLSFHPTSGIYYCQKQTTRKTFNQEFLTLHLACQDLKAECFKVIEKPLREVCDFLEDAMRILRELKK